MPRNSDTFWSRVLFKDFIRHFRKMSPEQIAEDIAESMDALDDLNPDGDSFGSLMVRWANERMNGAFATAARENGKKGGRPRKNTTADAGSGDAPDDSKVPPSANISQDAPNGNAGEDINHASNGGLSESGTSCNHYNQEAAPAISTSGPRQAEAPRSRRAGGNSLRVAKVSTSPARSAGPMPADKQAVMDFASLEGLDIDDAYECWHVTVNERGGLTADNKPINNWKAYVRKWCETRAKRRTA